MSANGKLIHSLEEQKVRKKSDFVHLVFASINFFIMFSRSFGFINDMIFFIPLTLLSWLFYVLFLYYWKIRNQFFIIFNYGSTICTLILLLSYKGWVMSYFGYNFIEFGAIVEYLSIPIIIYFIYLLSSIKTLGTSTKSSRKFFTEGEKKQISFITKISTIIFLFNYLFYLFFYSFF